MLQRYWILIAGPERARLLSKVEGTDGVALLRKFTAQFDQHRAYGAAQARDQAQRFAGDLGRLLEKSALHGGYDRLILVAPDDLLPQISSALGPEAGQRLAWSMLQDMNGASVEQLEIVFDEMIGAGHEAVA